MFRNGKWLTGAGATLLAVFGAALLALTWSLWPLSNPRLDWHSQFDEALRRRDCAMAAWLAANAVLAHDPQSISAARVLNGADWCQDGRETFTDATLLVIDQQFAEQAPADRWKHEWRPGWGGRVRALPAVFTEEIPFAFDEAQRGSGPLFGVIRSPAHIIMHLGCGFALNVDPASGHYLMRRALVSKWGLEELTLADWDRRFERCNKPDTNARR